MATNYCDWTNGTSGGSGAWNDPYQTITQASTGLTGGDEVRVAKSPDDSALSGTLAFVHDSASITTSVDLTGELIPGDFISKTASTDWWEVITITANTLTLHQAYYGTTETVAAKTMGFFC